MYGIVVRTAEYATEMGEGWTCIAMRRIAGVPPGVSVGKDTDGGRADAIRYDALTTLDLNG
jgi:hypothetical protein